MIVRAKFSALKQSHWYEYVVRFALGGTRDGRSGFSGGYLGTRRGRIVLSVSGDLLRERNPYRETRRAEGKKGLQGKERGKDAAALDAAGAALGGIALAVFGAVIWFLASHTAAGSLALAAIAWFVVAILLWRVRRTMRVYRT